MKKKELTTEAGYNKDPIFLLSKEEFEKYKDKIPVAICSEWGLRDVLGHHEELDRWKKPTVKEEYDLVAVVLNGWERSHPGREVIEEAAWHGVYVRPALNINLIDSKKYHKIDKNTIYCGGIIWIKFCANAYIASGRIVSYTRSYACFPGTLQKFLDASQEEINKASSPGSYEQSDIRAYLLKWYKKHIEDSE